MTALGISLVMSYGLFALAAVAGLVVLRLLWPWLRQPESRQRTIWILVLIAAGATCLVLGQKVLDDVICHIRVHHEPRPPWATEPIAPASPATPPR
jgi:uncharacterized membrane protein